MSDEGQTITEIKKARNSPVKILIGLLFWVALPLVIGAFVAPKVVPRPAVGLIRVNTEIFGFSAEFVNQQIQEARTNPRIKAVVVQIDTPGGEVAATQSMFMELISLRRKMPVVGSIDSMAASGGFYTVMATDPIFAKPSSTVGNVGVWGYFPSDYGVNDVVLASGPFKLSASNKDEFLKEIEGIKQEFLATVTSQRGTRLKITLAELSQGLAYPGREAQRFGLIDELGSQADALDRAAKMAGIVNYETIDLQEQVINKYYEGQNPFYARPWIGAADPKTGQRVVPPGVYILYDVRLGSTK